MSQLSVFLVLVLTVINATGLSVASDSSHVRGGRQMWRQQGQGQGAVSRVSHAGASNSFRQTNRIVSPLRQGRHFPSSSHHNSDHGHNVHGSNKVPSDLDHGSDKVPSDNDITDSWFSTVLTDWEIQKEQDKQKQQNPKPSASICKAAGFFSNPDSCTDFHRCVDWTGKNIRFSIFHFTCPAGTIFDNSLSICNHPWAVKRPECTGYQEPLVVVSTQGPQKSTPSWQTPWTSKPTQKPTSWQTPWTPDSTTGWTQHPTSITEATTIGSGTVTQGNNTSQGPPKPFTLECKQNNKYSRHPLYCNRYYYCIWDSDSADWTFPSFTCPKGLLFDEFSQQCSNTAAPCDGILASTNPQPINPKPTVTQGPTGPTGTTPTTRPTSAPWETTQDFMGPVTSTEKTWEVDPVSSYSCPAPGYYPFEGDCIRFYKCVETEEGKLKGLLYRCPNGYGYLESMQRCRKEHELPQCQRFMTEALFRVEAARPLYVEDLKWFFVN